MLRDVIAVVLCGVLLQAGGCRSTSDRPPGYEGPLPSEEYRQRLQALEGSVFRDTADLVGGGRWRIHSFAVVPNPASPGGTGPVLRLERGDSTRYLPMATDEAVRRFFRMVPDSTAAGGDASKGGSRE